MLYVCMLYVCMYVVCKYFYVNISLIMNDIYVNIFLDIWRVAARSSSKSVPFTTNLIPGWCPWACREQCKVIRISSDIRYGPVQIFMDFEDFALGLGVKFDCK